MRPSRALVAGAALLGAAALGFGALSQTYRGTAVRALRERQPAEWAAAGRPAGGLSGEAGLLRFAHRQRYFALNDADLVSATRNFYYDRLAAVALGALSLGSLGAACAMRRRAAGPLSEAA